MSVYISCNLPPSLLHHAQNIVSRHAVYAPFLTKNPTVICILLASTDAHYLLLPLTLPSSAFLSSMAAAGAGVSLSPNSMLDMELWQRFMADPQITADCLPPDITITNMSTSKSSKPVIVTAAEQQETVGCILALLRI